MELTVQNIFGLLLRSGLMPDEAAHAMFQSWKQEAGADAQNVGRFARWLVARRFLTEYQVSLLAQGYAQGFFLGEYKILDRLGKGRMAGVYQAVHGSGQVVAIKVLPPSKAREPQLLGRFQREARLAMKLNHPNVVRSYQVGEADGLNYLVMEYLEGEPLDEVIGRRGRFPPAEAVRLIHQALVGLQHIHEQWLVHRDLKPSNLMLIPAANQIDTSKCNVKILDIGLGRAIFEDPSAVKPEDGRLTTTGAIVGTPDYMSPEQARDARAVDIRSDIYSLGCVLYQLLTGQTVFPDTNTISQMIRHATEEPRPLKEFNPAVPDGLQQIVSWMLAKDPAKRYPTPERAAQALQVFLAAGAEVVARAEPSVQMNQFLTWLEKGEKKRGPARQLDSGPLVPAASPAAVESPGSGGAAAARAPGSAELAAPQQGNPARAVARAAAKAAARASARKMFDAKRRGRRKTGKTRPQMKAIAPPAAAPAKQPAALMPDVQLVPVAPTARPSALRVTWRDFFMFALGVLGALFAIAFAYVIARLVS